jgi:hypothetical protein
METARSQLLWRMRAPGFWALLDLVQRSAPGARRVLIVESMPNETLGGYGFMLIVQHRDGVSCYSNFPCPAIVPGEASRASGRQRSEPALPWGRIRDDRYVAGFLDHAANKINIWDHWPRVFGAAIVDQSPWFVHFYDRGRGKSASFAIEGHEVDPRNVKSPRGYTEVPRLEPAETDDDLWPIAGVQPRDTKAQAAEETWYKDSYPVRVLLTGAFSTLWRWQFLRGGIARR